MTVDEESEVRAELRAFKAEWHAAQEKRARDFWTSFRWALGLGASFLVSFCVWAWFVTTGASEGREAAIEIEALRDLSTVNAQVLDTLRRTVDARAEHGTRISILEDR